KHIVLRDNRQRVLTMEVTGSGTVQALVRPYNAAGIAQADVLGTAVVLSAAWQPVTVVYIPSAADVSCKAGLSISSAAGVRIPVVTAAKFRDSNDRAEWSIGEGLGEVLVSSFTTQYRSLGNYNVGFSVREV
ncbi:MAG: hypothetical protein ACRD5H_10200, partial [Nitrososphaerales archaeon]